MSTYSRLLTHVVFSTKARHPWIVDEFRPESYACLGGIARQIDAMALAIRGVADYVHALVAISTRLSADYLVRALKSNSSRWIHERWPHRLFRWQCGYGAFSVSTSIVDSAARYIANQEEHHRRHTFQEEFLELLQRHGVDFDPRYLQERLFLSPLAGLESPPIPLPLG